MRMLRKATVGLTLAICLAEPGVARADEVTHWNEVLLQNFRTDFGQGCPCPLARAGAIVHVAIYDAVNSIDRTHEPYMQFLPASEGASREAAVAAAAYHTMMDLFPNSASLLDAEYAARLALIDDGPAKTAGVEVGMAAAAACLLLRSDDGSQTVEPYKFTPAPGWYRPTPPDFDPICNPEWVHVLPWCMEQPDHFRSNGPLGYRNMRQLLRSRRYADQVNEVKRIGARNSPFRTEEQTRIAFFWAVDVNGTCKPPGQMFQIAQAISRDRGLSLSENARLFAYVGMAMCDAGIAAWDMKYGTDIDLWRPITAIREADTDNNPWTTADPNWEPLNPFTPPFPAYVSGHATFAAAACFAMAEFFGTDRITFTLESEDPFYQQLPSHPPRTFHRLSDAAWENALSRVYLGVHYRMDAEDGFIAGRKIGRHVVRHFLRPLCTADFNGDGVTNGADVAAFLLAFIRHRPEADFNNDGVINVLDILAFLDAYVHC
jgi:hypothetical protein